MSENRIVELEEIAAYQARTIEELSEQLAAQWKEIDRLKKQFEVLTDRFLTLEETAGERPVATKPPHY